MPLGFNHLLRDHRGSVAVIFALTMFVLAGALGLGLDYARALAIRSNLQAAIDAAALTASPNSDKVDPLMATRVQSAFDYHMLNAKYGAVDIAVASTPIPQGIRVTATANVPTAFGRLLGINTLPINVVSEAVSAKSAFEIALVLDNTGSMAGAKMDQLKVAAKNLIDEVVQLSDPESVKFAVVPFSNYVNVGMAYRHATWMSVPNDYTTLETQCNITCPVATVNVKGTCMNDGVPYPCSWDQCPVTETTTCTGNNLVNHTWNGCVGSRKPAADLNVTASFSSPVPGLIDTWCNAPLARLTNDSSSIKTQVDGLQANGETYIVAGLIWGWRVLTPLPPFADGVAANSNPPTRKIMVLMTDGQNTKSQVDTNHEGGDTIASDAAMASLCTKIKADAINLYTIAFTVTDADVKTRLRSCASDASYFYDASNGAALQQSFQQIGGSLVKLSLSR